MLNIRAIAFDKFLPLQGLKTYKIPSHFGIEHLKNTNFRCFCPTLIGEICHMRLPCGKHGDKSNLRVMYDEDPTST